MAGFDERRSVCETHFKEGTMKSTNLSRRGFLQGAGAAAAVVATAGMLAGCSANSSEGKRTLLQPGLLRRLTSPLRAWTWISL